MIIDYASSILFFQRCRLGVATINNKLYVCGGYDGNTFLQSVEEYDPVNNQWRILNPMALMRSRVALVANMGKLWAIGGTFCLKPFQLDNNFLIELFFNNVYINLFQDITVKQI